MSVSKPVTPILPGERLSSRHRRRAPTEPPCWPCSQALQRRFWRSSVPEEGRMKARSRQRGPKCPPCVHPACAHRGCKRTHRGCVPVPDAIQRLTVLAGFSAPSIFPGVGSRGLGKGWDWKQGVWPKKGWSSRRALPTRARSGKEDQVKQGVGSPAAAMEHLPAEQEAVQTAGDAGSILGWDDPPEEGMATHSRTLAWRTPWTEEPGGLQSMGSQKSGTRLSS